MRNYYYLNTTIGFKKLSDNAVLPSYAREGDAGMDVRTTITEPITLQPLERHLFPTGLAAEIPTGFEIQVRPRSGLALKHGITVLNTPGTIDSGYKNEIGVILVNLSNEPFTINPGERIAQFVVSSLAGTTVTEIQELNTSNDRGGGFGHTGVE